MEPTTLGRVIVNPWNKAKLVCWKKNIVEVIYSKIQEKCAVRVNTNLDICFTQDVFVESEKFTSHGKFPANVPQNFK